MAYKSRRILAQHWKRIWIGAGRRIPRIKPVNIGVKPKRIPSPYGTKRIRVPSLMRFKNIKKPEFKRIRYTPKSFSANPDIETPQEFIKSAAGFRQEDIKDIESNREYFVEKEKLKMRRERSSQKEQDLLRAWDLAKDRLAQQAITNKMKDIAYAREAQEAAFNQHIIDEENRKLSDAIGKIEIENKTAAKRFETELNQNKLRAAKNNEEYNLLLREMLKADSSDKLREARKELVKKQDEYDLFKQKQKELARKINPFGINIKINPIFGKGFSFGKIIFPKMTL